MPKPFDKKQRDAIYERLSVLEARQRGLVLAGLMGAFDVDDGEYMRETGYNIFWRVVEEGVDKYEKEKNYSTIDKELE